ncbi:AraC family transcriptional regulator [Gracilibacillus salitolerans]|uniref:AraC family transcriptional regulator n=1 Tax=Gracilibacillus salitolerans TaxID=2663022 RepID=A0A5Q2THW4_9BACI|nr:AraC family transcriptional regulator [Gracilibacillus salitolerans]QGH33642.1 AraC family transcriptional regulator [Gracilibacillus salitolerans]
MCKGIGGQQCTVQTGNLFIFNKNVSHQEFIDRNRSFKALFLGFCSLQIKGLPDNHLIDEKEKPILQLEEEVSDFQHLILQIIHEIQSDLPESNIITNGLLSALIGRLIQQFHHQPNSVNKRKYSSSKNSILTVKKLIEQRYKENWTLDRLAKKVYLSPHHLCRQFKQKTGWSPGQYLIYRRMEVAKYLLSSTNYTMEQIASQIGYKSDTHFHQVFKKNTGITPGHFRVLKRGYIPSKE